MTKVHADIIDTLDYEGKRVVFTGVKHREKALQHPELNNRKFLKNLEETIENPDEVWEDYDDKDHRRCYYKKYSQNTYVKVVIWYKDNPRRVVTAFQINWVKETKYPGLKRLK